MNAFKNNFLSLFGFSYRNIIKNGLFLIDAETVHENTLNLGNRIGSSKEINNLTKLLFCYSDVSLEQKYYNITFNSPIGLAAGFDYKAKLTQFIGSLGFGFETVGTITNTAYAGNPKPRLGRLPKSKSLMVYKGFKNQGAKAIVNNLNKLKFPIPIGISIGRSNSRKLKTQKDSIQVIVNAFITFENSKVEHAYYELNISCPNLLNSNISFYPPKNLRDLLIEVDNLKIKKPIFVKMPIEKNNLEVVKMLNTISKHCPVGVIIGNLQKDRSNKTFDQVELKLFPRGNFSGKPTYDRSNELIKLTYKNYSKRFTIIGCGGVFNGRDAYEKITLGASLIQLITGLIYKGPQLVSQINSDLSEILKSEGLDNISEIVGIKNN